MATFWLWFSFLSPIIIIPFLKERKLMMFLPVGLLSIVLNSIYYQAVKNYSDFYFMKNLEFLTDIPPKVYGLLFIGTNY